MVGALPSPRRAPGARKLRPFALVLLLLAATVCCLLLWTHRSHGPQAEPAPPVALRTTPAQAPRGPILPPPTTSIYEDDVTYPQDCPHQFRPTHVQVGRAAMQKNG